jgi:hypothetical protein
MRLPNTLALILLALIPSSCLDFDQQDVEIAYDDKADRLDVLLVYRGLYQDNETKAERQLDALLGGERWFALFDNWPFEFRLDGKDDVQRDTPAYAALRKHVTVQNGAFFRAQDGRLCAWQCLRLADCAAFFQAMNAEIHKELEPQARRESFLDSLGVSDEASLRLLAGAVEKRFAFVERRGAAFAWRVPLSDVGHKALVRHVLGEAAKNARKGEDGPGEAIAWLSCIELSFLRSGDVTELVLGNPARDTLAIKSPSRSGYQDNLAPLLERRKVKVRDDVTEQTLRAAFTEFRAK